MIIRNGGRYLRGYAGEFTRVHNFSPWFDILSAVAAYTLAVVLTLRWVFRSGQEDVPPTDESARRVVTRIAIIVVGVLGVCYLADVAFWVVIAVFLLLVVAAVSGDMLGIVGLPAVALAYFLKAYVLGFPGLILDSPSSTQSEAEPAPLPEIGRTARVFSPLKPTGQIELDNVRWDAVSESGDFIGQGASVVVVSERRGTLLVREETHT